MNRTVLLSLLSIISFIYIYYTGSYKSLIVILLAGFLIYIHYYGDKDIIETFPWHYRPIHYMPLGVNRYYRMDYVPPIILPPHYSYGSIYPMYRNSLFCARNPLCYPCPGWKYVGPPHCM